MCVFAPKATARLAADVDDRHFLRTPVAAGASIVAHARPSPGTLHTLKTEAVLAEVEQGRVDTKCPRTTSLDEDGAGEAVAEALLALDDVDGGVAVGELFPELFHEAPQVAVGGGLALPREGL